MEKNWLKRIRLLHQKKHRKQEKLFLVEGRKNVLELLSSTIEVEAVFGTSGFYESLRADALPPSLFHLAKEADLIKAGTFKSNRDALAVAQIPSATNFPYEAPPTITLALDDVRDPGNLGTIIRIADWYGIQHICCSLETADIYNPKVLHATMGSFTRVQVHYVDMADFLAQTAENCQLYAATMEGKSLHATTFETPSIVLMGNESHGINAHIAEKIHHHISIPKFGKAESLNVAMATTVFCDNFRQQHPIV